MALQTDRGRLRYIEPSACAQPPRVHDGAETPSAISLKQASTIAEMRKRIKDLEREVKELRRANEILKLASAFFAQAELDRRLK
jgi:transposase-like protein